MFVRLLSVLVVLVGFFAIWQITIPLMRNRPIFPLFRKSRVDEVIHEIAEAEDEIQVETLKARHIEAVERAHTLRRQNESKTKSISRSKVADNIDDSATDCGSSSTSSYSSTGHCSSHSHDSSSYSSHDSSSYSSHDSSSCSSHDSGSSSSCDSSSSSF